MFGDTHIICDGLRELGGRYNPRLTFKGEKQAGWIFPKHMREDLENFLEGLQEQFNRMMGLDKAFDDIANYNDEDIDDDDDIDSWLDDEENVKHSFVNEYPLELNFHKVLKDLLEIQGHQYLTDPSILDILDDYKAFDGLPAVKGIMRIIINDGYYARLVYPEDFDNVASSTADALYKSYAIDPTVAMYTVRSMAYALGITDYVPSISQPHSTLKPNGQPKLWFELNNNEKEEILNKLVVIEPSDYPVKVDSIYIVNDPEHESYCFTNYELSGDKLPEYSYFTFCQAIYDKQGRLRSQYDIKTITSDNFRGGRIIGSANFVPYRIEKDEISRIVYYFQ